MTFYHYLISNKTISSIKGQIFQLKQDFTHYEAKSFGEGEIYYRTANGKITEIVVRTTLDEQYATKEVVEFLENLG